MDKRRFLQMLTAMGAGSAAGAFAEDIRPVESCEALVEASYAAADVHCHIYNARDLPITGFVTQVVMSTWPSWERWFAQGAIWIVAHFMDAAAIDAKGELREIQQGHTITIADLETQEVLVAKRVTATLAKLRKPASWEVRTMNRRIEAGLKRAGLAMPSEDEQNRIIDRVKAEFPQAADRELTDLQRAEVQGLPSLAGIITMGVLMTSRRRELLLRLSALPASHASELKLFTPATIDLSYWVADQNVSPLGDQIEVMSAIAAIRGRSYAVHPYVSYCPWRQLCEPGQFDLVRQAVREKGFIGVKIYPVMGFLPIGNATATDPNSYPADLRKIKNWGKRLDAALMMLYEWSMAEDVPIVAHCSESQTPSCAAGRRAAPQNWKTLLDMQGFAGLRLNLAHCGGLWDLALPQHNNWTEFLIGMLADANYPNLYADISDYEPVMHRSGTPDEATDKQVMAALAKFLRQDASGRAGKQLMYGTDWVMLSRQGKLADYYPCMRTRLPSALNIDAGGYVGGNAARFLGIAAQSGQMRKPRLRLECFYAKHGLDNGLLRHWDS